MIVLKAKPEQYGMLKSWWNDSGLPMSDDFIPETTWVLYSEDQPKYSLGLVTTNLPGLCYIENFIKNPNLESKHEESKFLFDYVSNEAKKLGFKRIVLFSQHAGLNQRYESFGMKRSLSNVSTYCKELR